MKTILSLCDYTGNWPAPYREAGYHVIQVDLRRDEDVRLLTRLAIPIHGILAAPPCNHFARVGARLWAEKGDEALLEGLAIVDACLRAVAIYNPTWWALENPIGRLKDYLGEPAFKFDPCEFGDPWTKRTWIWGRFTQPMVTCPGARKGFLATLQGTPGGRDRTTLLSGHGNGKQLRSATPMGFARAFFRSNP